jgi:nitroreductase
MATKAQDRLLSGDQLRWVIEQAARAPSIYNTQPWRFTAADDAITLHADLQRGLAVSDPDGRELVISCGAALFNLRLALRQLHLSSTTSTSPDREDPRALACVQIAPGPPPSDEENRLFGAIRRRHTHRGGFSDDKIRPDLAARLQSAAASQGAHLVFVHDPGPQRQVLHLARAAERARQEDPRVRYETEEWTPPAKSARRDGVPASTYSPGPPAGGTADLAGRDFDLDRYQGRIGAARQPTGGIAVIVSDGDLAVDWLRAGEALEAVLLTAAADWAFAVLHSRVTEVPGLRADLRRELGTAGFPQLLMKFGYDGVAPTTPRRPATDVIDLPD